MRASQTRNGVTLRVIAGTHSVILGFDLEHDRRKGCLGFSIRRVDLGPPARPYPAAEQAQRWLPNMLQFPSDKTDPETTPITTLTAPLQKFRWGDYTCTPGSRYRYQVIPRYRQHGTLMPAELTEDMGVSVEITTEDNTSSATQVFFNRAAAASEAFERKFGKTIKTEAQLLADTAEAKAAKAWLSRGLEEAILAFLERARDRRYQVHAAIYEFQKPSLLAGIKAARQRGVDVEVVYHHRCKGDKDRTATKNDAAIELAKLPAGTVSPRETPPQGAIMHNKFVVLLEKAGGEVNPISVLVTTANWTDGGIYGQLNVAHVIDDASVARAYDEYWKLLKQDLDSHDMKQEVEKLTPVSALAPPPPGMMPIFSPQKTEAMLHLYANACAKARCVFVSAPFALAPVLLEAFTGRTSEPVLRFFLLDTEGGLGKGQAVRVIENDPVNAIGIATTLPSALHDFQGRLLAGKESFRHAGIHIHSKIILVNPFGTDPILIFGSANFSHASTETNDSNSLVIRGITPPVDIYATEFMRMFETYHFRASVAHKLTQRAESDASGSKDIPPLALKEDDSWSRPYFVPGSARALDRMMFAGTLH